MIINSIKKNILIILAVAICLTACVYGFKRDLAYWKKHRQEFLTLSEEVRQLHKITGIRHLTRYAVSPDPKTEIKVEAIATYYPKYESDIRHAIDQLISMNILSVTVGSGYVDFFIKSGGLGTDIVLVHLIDEHGLDEFAKDYKKFGLEISFKMDLEKGWLYVYTD
jgi:hypothetical protein